MSNQTNRPNLKLTDLPLSLRSQIVSFLAPNIGRSKFPHRFSPSISSLDDPGPSAPHKLLSKGLLSAAISCKSLADATAYALGSAVRHFVLKVRGPQIAPWITALGSYVKVVSFAESPTFRDDLRITELVRALSGQEVGLEVLKISNFRFPWCKLEENLLIDGIRLALERSGSSLSELRLPADPRFAEALKKVQLPMLRLVELDFWGTKHDESMKVKAKEVGFSEAVKQMLQSLDGHADRSRKLSTIRELRLNDIEEAPFTTIEEAGCSEGLLCRVQTLRIKLMYRWRDSQYDSFAMFINLFPDLHHLYWSYITCKPRHIQAINGGCPNLKKMHLQLGYFLPGTTHLFDEMFCATQGKLRSLSVLAFLTIEQIRVLGESNPMLASLSMKIGRQNVSGLLPLLASHCRHMRTMRLEVGSGHEVCLGAEGWRTLSKALCSSSEDLHAVTLDANPVPEPKEEAVEPSIHSIEEVIDYLCTRAQIINFDIPIQGADTKKVIRAMCRIFDNLSTHAKKLKVFKLYFHVVHEFYELHNWDDAAEAKSMITLLTESIRKFRKNFPRLERFDIGSHNFCMIEELAEKLGIEFKADDLRA